MNSILIAPAPAHFLTGLALLTFSAMTYLALRRAIAGKAARWGLSALVALALAEWCDLLLGGLARPLVCQLVRLTLEMVALTGLVELGRLGTGGPRGWLLPRWSYAVVASLALGAVLLARLNPLEFTLRLAICWQAGWLAANYFARRQASADGSQNLTTMATIEPHRRAPRAIAGALLVYLVAACVAIPSLGMLAAFVAVAAAYLAFGPCSNESRRSQLLWRSAWPAGFLLIAAGGCFAISAAGATPNDMLLAAQIEMAGDGTASDDSPAAEPSDADAAGSADGDRATSGWSAPRGNAARNAGLIHQAKRIGLGVSPIILFVLLIWGLSRLPFVH